MAQQIEQDKGAETVSCQRDSSIEFWMSHSVLYVDVVKFIGHSVHDLLAVLRTGVEEHVEQRVVGEVSQAWNRLQSDGFELFVDAHLLGVQVTVPGYGQDFNATHQTHVRGVFIVRLNQLLGNYPEVIHY